MLYRLGPSIHSPHVFTTAGDALAACLAIETATCFHYGYAVEPHFEGGERNLSGYRAKVLDMDGFTLGYLEAY